jgi:hypothetical protein
LSAMSGSDRNPVPAFDLRELVALLARVPQVDHCGDVIEQESNF